MIVSKKQLIISSVCMLLLALGAWLYFSSYKLDASDATHFPEVIELQDEAKVEALYKAHKVVVLFVHMEGCRPCKRFSPKFNQLAHQHKREGVFFAKIERGRAAKLIRQYNIRMFPTVMMFKDGVEQKKFSGCSRASVQFFVEEIDAVLES